jgi:hypothetical protein
MKVCLSLSIAWKMEGDTNTAMEVWIGMAKRVDLTRDVCFKVDLALINW